MTATLMALIASPISSHHATERMNCSSCGCPWPCRLWAAARTVADARADQEQRHPPTVVYPERRA